MVQESPLEAASCSLTTRQPTSGEDVHNESAALARLLVKSRKKLVSSQAVRDDGSIVYKGTAILV